MSVNSSSSIQKKESTSESESKHEEIMEIEKEDNFNSLPKMVITIDDNDNKKMVFFKNEELVEYKHFSFSKNALLAYLLTLSFEETIKIEICELKTWKIHYYSRYYDTIKIAMDIFYGMTITTPTKCANKMSDLYAICEKGIYYGHFPFSVSLVVNLDSQIELRYSDKIVEEVAEQLNANYENYAISCFKDEHVGYHMLLIDLKAV